MARQERGPWTFEATKWYGYVLAAMFLLKGGVDVVLGMLDRNYDDMNANLFFLLIGVLLAVIAVAYRDQKKWGWQSMIGLNVLIVLGSVIKAPDSYYLTIAVIALAALVALMLPETKKYVLSRS